MDGDAGDMSRWGLGWVGLGWDGLHIPLAPGQTLLTEHVDECRQPHLAAGDGATVESSSLS